MPHHQVLLFADDPALERVLGDLFPDDRDAVVRVGSLEEVGSTLAGRSVAVITADAWVRPASQTLSSEQRAQLLDRGRTAAVILVSGDAGVGDTAGNGGGTAIIVDKPYQLERLAILVSAAAGHDPRAESAFA